MIKRRPAVVVSPRLPFRDRLCAVVPLSGSEPYREQPYVVRLDLTQPLPHPFEQRVWWAKCDMVATVSFDRLDLFRTDRDLSGKRRYIQPKLGAPDFVRLQCGLLAGLGLAALSPHLTSRKKTPQ
jgi:mRNA interferase MazF